MRLPRSARNDMVFLGQLEDFVAAAVPGYGYVRAVGGAGQAGSCVYEHDQPGGGIAAGMLVQHQVLELVS